MERIKALVGRPPEHRYPPMASSCQVRLAMRCSSGLEGQPRGTLASPASEVHMAQRDLQEEMEVDGHLAREASEGLEKVHQEARRAAEEATTLGSTEMRAVQGAERPP